MKTLAILFFFTIAATVLFHNSLRAQSSKQFDSAGDSILGTPNVDSLNDRGVIIGNDLHRFYSEPKDFHWLDSLPSKLKARTFTHKFHPNGSDYYYPDDKERYYMDIIPFSQKAKRMDRSNIWLLKQEISDAAEIPPAH